MPMVTAPVHPRVSRRARWVAAFSLLALLTAVAIMAALALRSAPAGAGPDSAGAFAVDFVQSFRGTEATPLAAPMGVAAAADSLYIADPRNARIAVFGMDGALERTLSDTSLVQPVGVAVDSSDGSVWVADRASRALVSFSADGAIESALEPADGDAGTAGDLASWTPVAIEVADERLYVADLTGGRVCALDAAGRFVVEYGAHGSAAEGRLSFPVSVRVANGEVFVADGNNRRIAVFDSATGEFRRALELTGVPRGIAVIGGGTRLLVSDATSGEARVLDARTGQPLAVFGAAGGEALLVRPHGLAAVGDRFIVTDSQAGRVSVWRFKESRSTAADDPPGRGPAL